MRRAAGRLGRSAVAASLRRDRAAVAAMLRAYPEFWQPGFWASLRIARQAQARGAMQKLRELAPLLGLLRRRPPAVVVEIGTARGGTLYAWCRVAAADATIVSIDLPGGRFGGGYGEEDVARFRRYGRPCQELHFIRGDSHDESSRARLEEILGGRQIDFLFVDGDHTYDGVRRDFELYSPLVAPGRPIAFHDILPHPDEQSCEVDRFWGELKVRHAHVELVDPVRDAEGRQYGGIGVAYVTGDEPATRR